MASPTQNFPVKLPTVPSNYPSGPAPGKLQSLLVSNENYLYHQFSPYTNYHDSLFSGVLSNQQPFVYTYIDNYQNSTFNNLPESVQSLGQITGIIPDSVNDVVRVSKFLISSWGVQFLITQAAIQRLASFDETRLYNPASPILASVVPLTLGLGDMPMRHIEGGLLGLANSVTQVVGINLSNGFQTPSSTVGSGALPTNNTGQGKGLIRGGDANSALTTLNSKWVSSTPANNLGLSGLLSTIGSSFKSFFGKPDQSPGIYRADEQTSDLMYDSKTIYITKDGTPTYYNWFQPWYNGNTGTIPGVATKLYPVPQYVSNNIINTQFQYLSVERQTSATINGHAVGYSMNPEGTNYTDVIFPAKDEQFTNSDILVNYADYIKESQKYITKFSDPTSDSVKQINKSLKQIIDDINKTSTYIVNRNLNFSYLLPTPDGGSTYIEYDNWTNKKFPNANKVGVSGEYQGTINDGTSTIPKTIDNTINSSQGNLRMATTFKSDGINMLGILSFNNGIVTTFDGMTDKNSTSNLNSTYPGWVEYKPYDDDLIAFFFYDVVNDKYIPFRATVKGISEGNTAYWDELRFIGRSDQIYSYNGFSRTLSFTFNVVINSVNELLPTWKKINYIASSVKPSNYTTGQEIKQSYNKFIVPPMFMVTIGDLYKFQPMVITSINVNIPDDASWETLNENNAKKGWSYLNGLITAPNLGMNYGQLPREAEIAVTCNLLEKERAVVGGSHYGHEPRKDNWESINNSSDRFLSGSSDTPYLPTPTILHQNFVEWNNPGTTNPTYENSKRTINQQSSNTPTTGNSLNSRQLHAVP